MFVSFLLITLSLTSKAETQLFSNFENPSFEKSRTFIEQVHEHFSFNETVNEIFIDQTLGPILNSFTAESACVKKLGGDFKLATDLLERKKYQTHLRDFFNTTDGPEKARVFSGILLGALNASERAELLLVPGGSKLVNRIVSQHFISLMLLTSQSAFTRAAQYFYAVQCLQQ